MVASVALAAALQLAAPAPDCSGYIADASPVHLHYIRVVSTYREDRFADALSAWRSFDWGELQRIYERLDDVPNELLENLATCIGAAALFHTDAGLDAASHSHRGAAAVHFDAAWRLTHFVEPERARRGFQRAWLYAMALSYHRMVFDVDAATGFREAERYLERALDEYPDDPEILLAAGALYEWSGSLPRGEPAHLREAEKLLARAVRHAPDVAEANLRYGYVLEKRGHFDEADARLRRVLELEPEPHLIYRARLSLGKIAERRGLWDEALSHYRGAIEIFPEWQVAYLALSHALHSKGERAAASAVLDEALVLPASDDALFGYWSYELGLSPRADDALRTLRKAAP